METISKHGVLKINLLESDDGTVFLHAEFNDGTNIPPNPCYKVLGVKQIEINETFEVSRV